MAIFLAVVMSFAGFPAGCHSIFTVTAAGSGRSTWSQGWVVTLFGQVVYTYTQVSITVPIGAPPPTMPLNLLPLHVVMIVFALNFAIASILSSICWLIIKTVKCR